jgi:N-acyl-D-amino-acid deacylase
MPVSFRSSLAGCVVALLLLTTSPTLLEAQGTTRARDLGVVFDGAPGTLNAITDVPGVEVGQVTLVEGEGPRVQGEGPIRTGVTAVLPRGRGDLDPVFAGWFNLNGNGEITGTAWVDDSGFLTGPFMLTNTFSLGTVRDAVIEWQMTHAPDYYLGLPVVGETSDRLLNDRSGFHVTRQHAFQALDQARGGPVEEGGVGGGTGTMCHGFKAGIGTSSRVFTVGGESYTVGVLVQCNYGARELLTVSGVPVGRYIRDLTPCHDTDGPITDQVYPRCSELERGDGNEAASRPQAPDRPAPPTNVGGDEEPGGSIIILVATDAPLLPHQLSRVARRAGMGLARLGSIAANASGDLFLAFSTGNEGAWGRSNRGSVEALPNGWLNPVFEATIQATEEAILNSLIAAETMVGADHIKAYALPHDRLREVLARYNRLAAGTVTGARTMDSPPTAPESSTDRSQPQVLDLLLLGGHVLDGAGNPSVERDVGVSGARISFVGRAGPEGVEARDTLDVTGLVVTPGFWDMHSHGNLGTDHGRLAEAKLTQGITTIVIGVDGGGQNNLDELYAEYERDGIAVNVARYVGHNAARRSAMGDAARDPTPEEMEAMKAYVEEGMRQGAVGLSTGLFYVPGTYASTEEVIELNRVNARFGGVYDTHDRDLGASYQSVGYDASVMEAIEIGETAGTPVVFSHFNPQGVHNYGRAPEGARMIEEARARGVDVMAAQHPYTATHSSLAAYAIPRWASDGGWDELRRRFDDPETRARLDVETMEMLEIRGGAEKILFTATRDGLNGRTLAEVARGWDVPVPEAVRRILYDGNAGVMNLDLYEEWNTRYLAQQEWMMTCTDGGMPTGDGIVHPRSYGAFAKKLREMVLDDDVISLPFAIRGMTSLASTFLGFESRGLIKEGFHADIAVFDLENLRDHATYEDPHRYSEGTVHVLVNGQLALKDGEATGVLSGRPLRRGDR